MRRRAGRGGTFDSLGLSKDVLAGLKRQNYKLPTPIQRQTLPLSLAGKDLVAMARTGAWCLPRQVPTPPTTPLPSTRLPQALARRPPS